MFKKLASVTLVIALVCTLSGTYALADTSNDREVKSKQPETSFSIVNNEAKNEAKPNEKLRADMLKLLGDSKAGKVTPAARSQIQPTKSNNLSKKTKIAIGVGIGIAIIAIAIVVKYKRDHLFD